MLRKNICWFTYSSNNTNVDVGAGIFKANPKVVCSASLGSLATIFQAEEHPIDACAKLMEDNKNIIRQSSSTESV